MLIQDIKIGQLFKDSETGYEEEVLGTTNSSIRMTQKKRKEHGVNSTQWYSYDKKFIERFNVTANTEIQKS